MSRRCLSSFPKQSRSPHAGSNNCASLRDRTGRCSGGAWVTKCDFNMVRALLSITRIFLPPLRGLLWEALYIGLKRPMLRPFALPLLSTFFLRPHLGCSSRVPTRQRNHLLELQGGCIHMGGSKMHTHRGLWPRIIFLCMAETEYAR